MPAGDKPSIDVLVERFMGFERLVAQRFDQLDDRLDAMEFVPLAAYQADKAALIDRLQRIEADNTRRDERMSKLGWAVFTSIAAPLIVGLVLYLLLGTG